MSAWIVSKTHIDSLVQAGIEREMVRPEDATEFGRMLWAENLASIHARYPDTRDGGMYPGPIDFKAEDVETYTYEPLDGSSLDAEGVVFMAAGCYDYQTCEHNEYTGSKAEQFVNMLTACTEKSDQKGPWGVDSRDAFLVTANA